MNKVNGKNKGNTFERKIANLLSEKFKNYLNIEKGFRRNPDSGSFFGGINESRSEIYDKDYALYGDLICPRNFKFSIECKHYKSTPTFQSLLNKDIKEWDKWIKQAEQDSLNSSKKMLLIIKYNNVDEFVIVGEQFSDIDFIFSYKGKFIYKLNDVLLLDMSTFFENFRDSVE